MLFILISERLFKGSTVAYCIFIKTKAGFGHSMGAHWLLQRLGVLKPLKLVQVGCFQFML
jgi:hypothetical protein